MRTLLRFDPGDSVGDIGNTFSSDKANASPLRTDKMSWWKREAEASSQVQSKRKPGLPLDQLSYRLHFASGTYLYYIEAAIIPTSFKLGSPERWEIGRQQDGRGRRKVCVSSWTNSLASLIQ